MKSKIKDLENLKNIDLLIIDIDDTFLPHRTVSIGYNLFWKYFFMFPKNLRLINYGIKLYTLKLYREFINKIRNPLINVKSNNDLIRSWSIIIKRLEIYSKDYAISKDNIKKKIYLKTLKLYNEIRKQNPNVYVLAITQSFNICSEKDKLIIEKITKTDPICNILKIDELHSNIFYVNNSGKIISSDIIVKDGFDKLSIAEKVMRKIKPRTIGLFIDDYDDLALLRLKNKKDIDLRIIFSGKKIRKYIINKFINSFIIPN
ncbi:MAG: hypothetical protein ABIG89_01175 [Candidatus Woesearchaeota archaeon]